MSQPSIMLAAPESDAHVVSLKLLEWALIERGYRPQFLGVCRPTREIAEAAADAAVEGPVLVFLACQNGHGLTDLADLGQRLAALGVADRVRVFAGGKLAVGAEADVAAVRDRYRAIGITPLGSIEEAFDVLQPPEVVSEWSGTPQAGSRN